MHGLCQAVQKRGLPRALLTDNGAAMLAAETREGLTRLGIVHHTTLPHSPYQNGKQEHFWTQIEGRLMAMLEAVADLSLPLLNRSTQAWVEMEYHRRRHGESGQTPIERFVAGPDLTRPVPAPDELVVAFTASVERTQRQSDGSVSVQGVRYEVPNRYRHLHRLQIRCASWDRSHVLLVDARRAAASATCLPGVSRPSELCMVWVAASQPIGLVAPRMPRRIDEPRPGRQPEMTARCIPTRASIERSRIPER